MKLESHSILPFYVPVGTCSAAWTLFGLLFFLNVIGAAAWCYSKSGYSQKYLEQ